MSQFCARSANGRVSSLGILLAYIYLDFGSTGGLRTWHAFYISLLSLYSGESAIFTRRGDGCRFDPGHGDVGGVTEPPGCIAWTEEKSLQ
jgi:hypothetical protein